MANSLPVRETLIARGKWTPQSGSAAVESLLASQLPFSAIIASNDDMAIGAMKN